MPGVSLAILIIARDDDPMLPMLRELRHLGYLPHVHRVDSPAELEEVSGSQAWDLAVADYDLQGFNGMDALRQLQRNGADIPFIMVSQEESQYAAVASLRAGAYDYIPRSNLSRLMAAVERGLNESLGRREKKRVAAALYQSERFIRSTLDSLKTQVAILDQDGIIVYTNRAWRAFAVINYEVSNPEMLGLDYLTFCRTYDRGELIGQVSEPISTGIGRVIKNETDHFDYEFSWAASEGTCWLELQVTQFAGEGPMHVVLAVNEITERKFLEQKLAHLSAHDLLTGLYNRAYFETALHSHAHPRYMPVGIVNCDVNGLKLINDTVGSETGDVMLMMTAEILLGVFPDNSIIARTGGDEFSVLIPNTTVETVERLCQSVRSAVQEYNRNNADDSRGISLSLSMGYAVGGGSVERICECAREAENSMQREKLHSGQSARSAIINTLKKLLEVRDFHTEGHATRLIDVSERMARLLNLSEGRIADIRLLAQFHDIGKVGIPDHILFKPGSLTQEEYMVMRRHSDIGYRIALASPELLPVAEYILKHHEWWNGNGYPLGIKGTDIPIECRILGIVDAFDAMTSERTYRKPMTREQALDELRRGAGVQFDPDLVELFLQSEGKE